MKPNSKEFDRRMYNRGDIAKMDMLNWLHIHQPELEWQENPDIYGVDLVANNGNSIEVEINHNWIGHTYPFKYVHVPGRKARVMAPKTYFVMMNHERTHALVTGIDDLLSEPTVFRDTKYTVQELFYRVPIWKCLSINVTAGTDTINALGNERTATNGDGSIS